MTQRTGDSGFVGSIPELYERYMVPLMFEVYAQDLAQRVAGHAPQRVLEIACGTGVVTRQLAKTLPASTTLVATDLNPPMLEYARRLGTARPVTWQQADAMQLPFPDAAFDAVVCQFGVMFLPDRARAYAEVLRVLRPGGHFLFNVWGPSLALREMFPGDPPRFMERVPHGYFDSARIAADLASGGFTHGPEFVQLTARGRAETPRIAAIAICQGTPLRTEIVARRADALEAATQTVETAIALRFGPGPVDGQLQALVITVQR